MRLKEIKAPTVMSLALAFALAALVAAQQPAKTGQEKHPGKQMMTMGDSHAYFYTYGIPFQDFGLRAHYEFSPKVYAEFYALKGWNVTFDNNGGKTFGLTLGYAPSSKFRLNANYLAGPERNNNSRDRRDQGDFQIVYFPTKTLQTAINIDIGRDKNTVAPGQDAKWGGVTLYVRKNINGRFFPTLRAKYYASGIYHQRRAASRGVYLHRQFQGGEEKRFCTPHAAPGTALRHVGRPLL
jgi:hypothetical protein